MQIVKKINKIKMQGNKIGKNYGKFHNKLQVLASKFDIYEISISYYYTYTTID